MSDKDIRPALTADEWNPPLRDGSAPTGPRCGDEAWIEGGAVWVPENRDGEQPVENPHGLAALCLYQQPFGFDANDVRQAEEAARQWDARMFGADVRGMNITNPYRSLAARIAALLPHEETP